MVYDIAQIRRQDLRRHVRRVRDALTLRENFLRALIDVNVSLLSRHKDVPSFFELKPRPVRFEHRLDEFVFHDVLKCMTNGCGENEDLVAWCAAELKLKGRPFKLRYAIKAPDKHSSLVCFAELVVDGKLVRPIIDERDMCARCREPLRLIAGVFCCARTDCPAYNAPAAIAARKEAASS